MPIEKNKLQLENHKVIMFNKSWDKGNFNGARYGQAFYDYFKLDRIVDQKQLMGLYNVADDSEARKLIKTIFKLT